MSYHIVISNTPSNFLSKLHHILSQPKFRHVSSIDSINKLHNALFNNALLASCLFHNNLTALPLHNFCRFSYNKQIISRIVRNWTFVFISFIVLNCTITSIDYAIFYINLSPFVTHHLILSHKTGHGRWCTKRTHFPKYFVQLSTTLSLVSLMDGASNNCISLEMTTMPITTSAS